MADDVQLSAAIGVGVVAGADAIGGVYYQRVKLIKGADGVNDGDVSSASPLPVAPQAGATGTHSSVVESAASATLLASNTARLGWSIYNDSDAAVNIRLGAGASATVFAIRLLPRGFVSHKDFGGAVYTGLIAGIWDSTPGTSGHNSARVMELTS